MEKVLIFTISTGGGHNQAAESLKKEFELNGYQVIKVDALKESSKVLNDLITNGYKILANNFPERYGDLYRLTNKQKVNRNICGIMTFLIKDKIYDLIKKYQPAVVITTHPFVVDVIGELIRKGRIDSLFISIVTDYVIHQTYLNEYVDAYITGSYYTKQSLMERGIKAEKIFQYGIPIKKEFYTDSLTGRRRKEKDDLFTILLMGGSLGLSVINNVLQRIIKCKNRLRIIVVCGYNNKLKNKLEEEYRRVENSKNLVIYGYTDGIPILMDLSDIIITKPGGLTVTEAIIKNLPMIIPFLIPGQEKGNLDFLLSNNMAINPGKIDDLTEIIDNLISNPVVLEEMKFKLKKMAKDYSPENIVDLVDKMLVSRKEDINITIMTAGFGSGHHTTARAIKEHLSDYHSNLKIEIVDILKIMHPKFSSLVYKGYELLIKSNYNLYNFLYRNKVGKGDSILDDVIVKLYLSKIEKYMESVKPGMIISTFPLCSALVSQYKEKNNSPLRLITCITDIVDNSEWIYSETDKYLVASENTKENLIIRGVNRDKINVTGIPVREDFFISSSNLMSNMQIKPDDFVILMMGGGFGLLPGEKSLYKWLNSLQGVKIIILTANNQKLYRLLSEEKLDNIVVMDYTNRVAELMKMSDILITKAGGVTMFEAIISELPLISFKPRLGQERENVKFIEENKIGKIVEDLEQLKQQLLRMITEPYYRAVMRKNIKMLKNKLDTGYLIYSIMEIYIKDHPCENSNLLHNM